ncbi:MAG: phosphate-starvation-inducible PsiE family protein [Parachlamydia sp.]|uniref:phosphate-starvation-inducible PsiE family protein n=2 Tax=Parachlamydia TaxID=83551 RepID=UPI00030DD165|nr:phosphate-starvation-inducible PsiE family protein [Parachlamydia acanthamoebae]
MNNLPKESLMQSTHDPLVHQLSKIIVYCVKFLAILMVIVVIWSLVDVVVHLYENIVSSVTSRFSTERLLSTLGSFLAVLIAIEIFLNIIFYLKKDAIHVPLVLATALTAVARKVIILDYSKALAPELYATAALILSLGITYWLVTKNEVS